jgi:hypothetical protein
VTDDQLDCVCDELSRREPIFHHPDELGATQQDFEEQTIADYWEVGASGNVYTGDEIWPVLAGRYSDPGYEDVWATSDFACRRLGEDTYLLTYVLHQGPRITRRSTIWRRTPTTWQVVYHQGTIVDPG